MTNLEKNALGFSSLSSEFVQAQYHRAHYCDPIIKREIEQLCLSHERLRAELTGAEAIIADLEAKLAKALALTDTGSQEFKTAFPPRTAEAGPVFAREIVPGWRVVERIRSVLMGGRP